MHCRQRCHQQLLRLQVMHGGGPLACMEGWVEGSAVGAAVQWRAAVSQPAVLISYSYETSCCCSASWVPRQLWEGLSPTVAALVCAGRLPPAAPPLVPGASYAAVASFPAMPPNSSAAWLAFPVIAGNAGPAGQRRAGDPPGMWARAGRAAIVGQVGMQVASICCEQTGRRAAQVPDGGIQPGTRPGLYAEGAVGRGSGYNLNFSPQLAGSVCCVVSRRIDWQKG